MKTIYKHYFTFYTCSVIKNIYICLTIIILQTTIHVKQLQPILRYQQSIKWKFIYKFCEAWIPQAIVRCHESMRYLFPFTLTTASSPLSWTLFCIFSNYCIFACNRSS